MSTLLALLVLQAPDAAPAAPAPTATPVVATAAADPLPEGKSRRTIDVGGTPLEVFFHKPAQWSGERLLLVMHGTLRNADEYRDHAVGMGDRFGALIAAPKFDRERFPSRRYQRGGIQREDGSAAPPEEWTYALIPRLVAAVRQAESKPDLRFSILGHSAGGQFVMRMSAFQDTGADCLVAANAGTALFPVRSMDFGYGFGGLPIELADDDRLRRYLAAPLVIYCGTLDDAPDEYFDGSADGMRQGGGRHQRNVACYWTGRTVAELRGWRFGWRLVEAPGVGHDHEQMFDHARCAVALFGDAAPAEAAPRGTGR